MVMWFSGIGVAAVSIGLLALLIGGFGWLSVAKQNDNAALSRAAVTTGWGLILFVGGVALFAASRLG